MSVESKLEKIVKKLRQDEVDVRHDAMVMLQDLKEDDVEAAIDKLVWVVKEAAKGFPTSGEPWDVPEYHLMQFVCQYYVPPVTEAISQHFHSFPPMVKEMLIEYMCESPDDRAELFVYQWYEKLLEEDTAIYPLGSLYSQPQLLKRIVTNHMNKIEHPEWKHFIYASLLFLLDNDAVDRLSPGLIHERLPADYEEAKAKFKEYEESYSTKFVYRFWKGDYFDRRAELITCMALLDYYFKPEYEAIFTEASSFKDPVVQGRALTLCMQKGFHYDSSALEHCATHLETSVLMYEELLEQRKDHLFPVKSKKQHYFARTILFKFLMEQEEYEDFPVSMTVKEEVNTENIYGQPVRYYLMGFTGENHEEYAAWVGAFSTENNDDSSDMWEGTYTDFEPFAKRTVPQHVDRFFKDREHAIAESEQEVHYEDGAGSKRVAIIGTSLVYENGKTEHKVRLHEVLSITVERKRSLFMSAIHIVVTGKDNKELFSFPAKLVDYDEFAGAMLTLTNHLNDPPVVEELVTSYGV
ncbi:hypothetical protein ACFFJY_01155 [Fictibacillus aquaticus]|uniref:Uncharacterized protein n=1 Tax=Fictibacillus aquaticus TaxID=2021314 RepID=A0A235F7P2_9BACL|nr:hypothetical protein [Fictibacillus aquaticus]OYD57326.1 hypothetical protein CGZ90_11630 [Fictibacillus aquaticus]